MRRLYRSTKDRMIAGIFGGIAEIFNWDPSLVRLLAVFIGLATVILPIFVTYIIAWIIIPERPNQ